MNEIIQELSKYSQKELENILNKKNIATSKYLKSKGSDDLYILLGRDADGRFRVANSGRNSYKELEYLFTPLTTKQFAEIKIKNLENLINNWSTERFTDFCKQQFIKCYGEEHVDFQGRDVFVYFPEVTISNSVEQSHVMRDIYLYFIIRDTYVSLNAIKRTTYTEKEIRNNYLFSHCSSSYNPTDWTVNSFCFGSTDVADLRESVRYNGRKAVFKNLYFFLEAIKEYLSWESLEGVPYRNIENVIRDVAKYKPAYTPRVNNWPALYEECINNIDSFEYSFNEVDGEYRIKLESSSIGNIASILTDKFPQYCCFYLDGQSVREQSVSPCGYTNPRQMYFKGEYIPLVILPDEEADSTLPKRIHNGILNQVVKMIENKFNEFYINKKLNEITRNR